VVLAFLLRFTRTILATDYVLLLLAFGFLAASAYVDLFVTPEEFFIAGDVPGRHLVEDGLKLFGIFSWAAYFVSTCVKRVSAMYPRAPG
jgi:hypothetical protein